MNTVWTWIDRACAWCVSSCLALLLGAMGLGAAANFYNGQWVAGVVGLALALGMFGAVVSIRRCVSLEPPPARCPYPHYTTRVFRIVQYADGGMQVLRDVVTGDEIPLEPEDILHIAILRWPPGEAPGHAWAETRETE
jgi:hypothetical protein